MSKKLSLCFALGLVSLSLSSPFSAFYASADVPPTTLMSGNDIISPLPLSTMNCTSSLYGDNTYMTGVSFVNDMSNRSPVVHSLSPSTSSGQGGQYIWENKLNNGDYEMHTRYSDVTFNNITYYCNGIVLTDFLQKNNIPGVGYSVYDKFTYTYTGELPTDNYSIAYRSYMAWFPITDNTDTNLRVRGLVIHSPVTAAGIDYVDNNLLSCYVNYDIPAEVFDYETVYMQYWIEFYTLGSIPREPVYGFSYVLYQPDYIDYGDYMSEIGILSQVNYDFNFMGAIAENVNSFLRIEILPNFSFYSILYIIFAVAFFGFILRVFLGG